MLIWLKSDPISSLHLLTLLAYHGKQIREQTALVYIVALQVQACVQTCVN